MSVSYREDPRPKELHPLTELNRIGQPIERAWAFGYHLRRCLHVGADDSGWILARPERSLLVIGPPRDTGKTTAVLVPTVLCAYAPVVAASTKDDVFAATAQTRALMGRLWHFAPDGSEPTPAGARKLRWSPVPAAKDWDMAVTTAEVMISVANATLGGHSSADGGFWSIQAGGLLAPLFHAAALADLDMRTVMRWVMLRDLSEAAQILESVSDHSPGTRTAWELLGGAARTARNELSGYWGSANAAVAPYRRESALEVTDRPNFDPTRFVTGRPREGGEEAWFDTVYINSSGLNQERLAPLIVALLTEIKEARYRVSRVMRARTDLYLPPTVLALDETANIAPIPDLPSIISQGGSQGVVVATVFQHLQQAKARWGAEGTGFLTTFQERLIFPGIWEPETLEAISVVVGEWDRPMVSFSEDAHSRDPRRSSYQHSTQRQRILPPSAIQAGRPELPEAALFLQGRQYWWIHTTPYYSSPPWPHLLVCAMERWAQAPADYPQRALPIPELDRENPATGVPWLWEAGGRRLCDRYRAAREALERPPATAGRR